MDVQYRRELSVNPAEIEQTIRANIDKTVRVVYADDTIEILFIHTVDDEGFVCDLASAMSQPPRCAYWVRFTDIREVHPARWESTLEIPLSPWNFSSICHRKTGSNGSLSLQTPEHPLSRKVTECLSSPVREANNSHMSAGCCFTVISGICVASSPLLAKQRPVQVHILNLSSQSRS